MKSGLKVAVTQWLSLFGLTAKIGPSEQAHFGMLSGCDRHRTLISSGSEDIQANCEEVFRRLAAW